MSVSTTPTLSTPKNRMDELVTEHWTRMAQASFPLKTSRAWRKKWPHLQLPFGGLTLRDTLTLTSHDCAMAVEPRYRLAMILFRRNMSQYVNDIWTDYSNRMIEETKKAIASDIL